MLLDKVGLKAQISNPIIEIWDQLFFMNGDLTNKRITVECFTLSDNLEDQFVPYGIFKAINQLNAALLFEPVDSEIPYSKVSFCLTAVEV